MKMEVAFPFDFPRKKRTPRIEIQNYSTTLVLEEKADDDQETMVAMKKMKLNNLTCSKIKYFQESSRNYSHEDDNAKQKKRKIRTSNKKQKIDMGPIPPPDLPEVFKNAIVSMGGTNIMFLIQKPLYNTDISSHHNRLSMPVTQIKATNFLTQEENNALLVLSKKENQTEKKKAAVSEIKVSVLDTKLEEKQMSLRKWDMKKGKKPASAKFSSTFVLVTNWCKLVDDNHLKVNDIIQVWSFRVGLKLHLAIVLVQKGEANGSTSTKAENNGEAPSTPEIQEKDQF